MSMAAKSESCAALMRFGARVRVQGLGLGFRVRVGLGVKGVGLEGEP